MKSFAFTQGNLKKANEFIDKYPSNQKKSALLPILDLAQRQCGGWLPVPAIEAVADFLSLPVINVYEVASFYTMFHLKPVGQYHIQICGTTPCMLCGCSDILKACEEHLEIKSGEITADGKFSLKEVECLGACVNAPVVMINDNYYENLNTNKIKQILEDLAESC